MANNKQSDYANALNHKYRVESMGIFVPGVTTAIGILDKPGLKWAASKITAQTLGDWVKGLDSLPWPDEIDVQVAQAYGEFDRVWREKANKGNRVHHIAECWTRRETVEVRQSDAGFVDALESFHHGYQPEFLYTESVVVNRSFTYGGRFDFIGRLNGPLAHGVYLCDFKSGSKRPLEAALQASAYWMSALALYNDDGVLTGFADLPEMDGARTIYLREDGTFEVVDPFEHISREQAFEMFLACLNLFNLNKQLSAVLKQGEKNGVSAKS